MNRWDEDDPQVPRELAREKEEEPLMKKMEASSSRMLNDEFTINKTKNRKNHTAAKAVAAAALGGGTAAGGATLMAATATATTATAGAVTLEAFGATAFAASGGFGAASSSVGLPAAVAMATPVGMIAAAGALGGLGVYCVINRVNARKLRRKEQEQRELVEKLEQKYRDVVEGSISDSTEEESSLEAEVSDDFQPLLRRSRETAVEACNSDKDWASQLFPFEKKTMMAAK